MFDYDDVLKARPAVGKTEYGEVEKLPAARANPHLGPYGIVYQCPYLTVVREPIMFPSLAVGTHIRVLQGAPGLDVYGVVILPIRPRPDGEEPEIALVRQFRYPRQGWMSEIPRGGVGSHERNATGAVRELREETGLPSPDIMVTMDDLVNDSGISATVCRYYMAVYMDPDAQFSKKVGDNKEAISDVVWVPLSEWREFAQRSPIPGRPTGGLDSFTSAAFGLAYMSGTLPKMEVAWNRVFEGRAHDSPRLSEALSDYVREGRQLLDVSIECRSEEVAKMIRADLPLLDLKVEGQHGEVLSAYDVPLLTIVWLSQQPGVLMIDELG